MAVPPSVKATTVSVELVALCVTVKVALAGPVSEPFSVPATETVAVSLSVIFTVPLPAVLTEAVLVGAERVTPGNDSRPSTNGSSTAVIVSVDVAPLTAPTPNEPLLEV